MRKLLSNAWSLVPFVIWPSIAGAAGITYHGRLLDSSSQPVVAPFVEFKIQIRTPGPEDCLLYEETHVRDMTASDGVFAITLGDGTAQTPNTEPFTLARAFRNFGVLTFGTGKCASGSSYAPAPGDGRKLAVRFNDHVIPGWEELPVQDIRQVPSALESMAVGGFGADSLLRVVDVAGFPAAVSPLTSQQYDDLVGLADKTNTGYVLATDPRLTDDRSPTAHTHAADEIASAPGKYLLYRPNGIACAMGEVLKWTASSRWECATESGGGVDMNGVFSNNTGLLVTNGTQFQNKACSANEILKWNSVGGWTCSPDAGLVAETDPKIGMNFPGALSKWNGVALVDSGVFESAGKVGIGTASPDAKLHVVGSLKIVDGTQGANKILTSDADGVASWQAPAAGSGSSSGTVGLIQFSDGTGGFDSDDDVYYDSGSKFFNAPFMWSVYQGSTLGTAADPVFQDYYAQSGMFFFAQAPTSGLGLSTDGQERLRITSTGNVGIGTAAPDARLEVKGQIVSQEFVVASGANVDFANGNSQRLQSPAGNSIALSGMVAGGNYNIVIEDTTSRTYTFTGCGTMYWSPASAATTGRSIFSIYRAGSSACYIGWTTGYAP